MEHIIARLLEEFERGTISRRELIRTLALGAAASTAGAGHASAAGEGFKAIGVNHYSYGVADYARTRDFYSSLLGMRVLRDNGRQCSLAFGDTSISVSKTPRADNKPFIDHIAFTIENFDPAVIDVELRRRGLARRPGTGDSVIIDDPDGFGLQISGKKTAP